MGAGLGLERKLWRRPSLHPLNNPNSNPNPSPTVYAPLQVDCPKYAPDMVSGSFGQCTCGAKRADHSEGALSHGTGGAAAREAKAYGKTKKDSAELHKEFTQKELVGCARYDRGLPAT